MPVPAFFLSIEYLIRFLCDVRNKLHVYFLFFKIKYTHKICLKLIIKIHMILNTKNIF
jgi:hypothetical protein